MFPADITFVLALIALVAGAFLLLFIKTQKEAATYVYKFIGFAVVILSIIMILCSGYGMLRWHFIRGKMMRRGRMMHMMKRPMHRPMHHKGLKPQKCPMSTR
jgi:hypothetical protein